MYYYFFINFFDRSLSLSKSISTFLHLLFCSQIELLLSNFYNLEMYVFFLSNTLLRLLRLYIYHCCILNKYIFLILIQQILIWFVHLIYISLIQLLFLFFLLGNDLSKSKVVTKLLWTSSETSLQITPVFTWTLKLLYPHKKVLHFRNILDLYNYTKIDILQFYSDWILISPNKQAYSLTISHFYSK